MKIAKKLRGESEIEAALRRLDQLTREEAQMSVQDRGRHPMFVQLAQTSGVAHVTISLVVMKGDQLQRDVHRWLSPLNPSTNQNFVRKARQKGTAARFFKSNTLTGWKAKGSLLWIHGNPGTGKSTLLSAIIQDVEHMDEAGLATIAYYYFDFWDVKKQDYGYFHRALVRSA